MLKKLSEVEARLRERYNGPTYEREGNAGMMFTYIPWEASTRLLDEIFGVFGWTTTAPVAICAEGQWTVTFSITARVLDDDGLVIEKTVPCLGSARAQDDNSAKKAMSDALSKGVKFFGDAFGFFIGEEAKAKRGAGASAPRQYNSNAGSQNATSAPRGVSAANAGKPASEPQKGMLKRLGYSGDTSTLTMAEASTLINNLKLEQASGF